MNRWLACVLAFAAIGLSSERVAVAKETATIAPDEPVILELSGERGGFVIPTHRGVEIRIRFQSDIRDLSSSRQRHPRYTIHRGWNELKIRMRGESADLATLNLHVETGSEHVSLRLHEVASADKAPPLYEVRTRDEERKKLARQIAAIRRSLTRLEATLNEHRSHFERAIANPWSQREALIPAAHSVDRDGGDVVPRILYAGWEGTLFVVVFEIANEGTADYRPSLLELHDEQGQALSVSTVSLGELAVATDGIIGSIPPRRRIQGAAIVHDASGARLGSLSLTLHDADTSRQPRATVRQWGDLVPLLDIWRLQARAERDHGAPLLEPPEPSIRGTRFYDLRMLCGVVWLGDGVSSENGLDAAALGGLALRATYAYNHLLALEADIAGASSGSARFEGTAVGGNQGDLRRRARLGRIQFSGVARMGERIIPTVRVGVGVQATSYASEFTSGRATMTVPDSPVEVDLITSVGAGVDARLGDRYVVGVGFAFIDRVNSGERQLEAGIHLGIVQNP